ncbi:MAG TPA: FAD-binding oxidoreductase [Gaiellaceae bacterium]|nr:FAD-binding oxidoreductase [Gaiellaceae bacterium]
MQMTGLDGGVVEIDSHTLDAFSATFDGRALRRGDPRFEEATRIWNAMASKRPALVVQPLSADDVREAIRFASANGILFSIKGGGHNIAGTSLADGGLTLDMSRMKTVEVDADRRLVRVGPGCLLGDVDRATQRHGLATVLGFVSQTGVAGLTLGGGFGYLTRRFGWTVDNLEEVEIVTADGAIRRAARDEHEDLFWALRGGGGNFGVVTRFTFRLHRIGPEVTAGVIVWEAEDAADVLPAYREAAEAAPRELALGAVIRFAPALPQISERWHGKPVVLVVACHTGAPSRASRDLAPLRALGHPIADLIRKKPYVEQQSMFDATQPKGMHNYWKSEFLPRLSGELLETFRAQGAGMASPMSMLWILQLGGALADHDAMSTPFGNRDADAIVAAAGCWDPGVPDHQSDHAWARSAWEALNPYSTGGNYINLQTADDDARLRAAYRDSLERLAQVKATYDPDNVFRVNRNIAPAAMPSDDRR